MSVISQNRAKGGIIARALAFSATLLACSDASLPTLEPPSTDQAFAGSATPEPATLGWQEHARTLVGANNLSPLAAARVYALLSVAQYGAIDEADDVGFPDGTLPDQGFGPGGRRRFDAERGAVVGASWTVLSYLFPAAEASLEQHALLEGSNWSREHFFRGIGVGKNVGNRMIEWAKTDHFADPWTGTVPVGPGVWRNNGPPAGALFGKVTPYFLTSGSQFRPLPPPAFGSPAFLADLDEIRVLSATRTAEQLESARYWNFQTGTPTPPGYWNELAGSFVEQNRLNERAAAHVFALMNAASMDALIGCWEAKYFYWFIRPSQVEPAITLPTGLPNHPSYPSGHSCVSSAATTVLAHFFPAHTNTLADQLKEAGLSRMYGGIHYRFDITAGERLGTSVAKFAITTDQTQGLLSKIR